MTYVAMKSRDAVDDTEWRVEAIDFDSEGECYLAIFSGPGAKARALEYATFKNSKSPQRELVRN